MASPEVIDLCSDDGIATSSPVRTRLENNVTMILSTDDETRVSTSETKSGRSARLKMRTLKAQALLNGKDITKASCDDPVSEAQVPLLPSSPAERKAPSVSTKGKRSRLSRATPPSNTPTPDDKPDPAKSPTPPFQATAGPLGEMDNPISQSYAENEGVEEAKEAELQLAIYNSLLQGDPAVDAELAAEDGNVHDEAEVTHNRDISVVQADSQSLPTPSRSDSVPPPERPSTPAPTVMHVSNQSDSNLPLSELNAHAESPSLPVPADAFEPEPHSDSEPALQDAILLSLIWQEGGMENDVANAVAQSVEQPSVSTNDPIVPSGESQEEPVRAAADHDDRIENTGAHTPVRPTTPLFLPKAEGEDKEMQDALFASLAQDGGSTSENNPLDSTIPLERHTPLFLPDNVCHENEDTELQNALMALFSQTEAETGSGDTDPVLPIVLSGGPGPTQPVPYRETVHPDDTSPYLPLHLSYAPPPLPDIYIDHENDPTVSPAAIQESVVAKEGGAADDSVLGARIAEEPALVTAVDYPKSGPSELNADVVPPEEPSVSVPGEPELDDEGESEDVQIQRALLQSLSLNTGPREEAGTDRNRDELGTTEGNGEKYSTDYIPTSTEATVSVASKPSSKPLSPQPSARHITPDKSTSPLDGPISSLDKHSVLSHTVRKRTPSITYSSRPLTALPRLLTPRFFAQSFLPPNCHSEARKSFKAVSPAVVEAPPPPS
jgi:hypothetical protein